ncbi:energy transducer TonB [Pseudoduganella violaceinigra]|uniref:energy transducer TonB n=1 Tax=Pseudoduganella violaceinigra TaxID=246602 RepID=UPI0004285412|nr:energy transducer TonB [Pseudoduganella violaceinigra]
MNFDTSRKNYSGLAFVAVLHLVAAGIALKHSTVLITHTDPGPLILVPPKPEQPKPEPTDKPEPRKAQLPVITPPEVPVLDFPAEPPITTIAPPDEPRGRIEPGTLGGGTEQNEVVAPRHTPVNVAAIIDAASCAKPAYPAAALRNGDEGTVTLAFLVGKDGHIASAKVERTSGHRDLDRAALQGLSMCAFKPGTIDGVAQESWARMQYAWRLDE